VPDFELVLLLLVIIAILVTVARKVGVAYPILLVLGGIAIGLAPGVPSVTLDPQLVLVVFLPPLIFAAAWETPVRDLRENVGKVLLLSIGLVLFTVLVVGVVAAALVPGLALAAALVLGAIVSPSDALAATTVLERLEVPHRIRAVLEEESLLNDATALTAYRTAVVATMSGTFVLAEALGKFGIAAFGGVAIGVAVGFLASLLWNRLDDPPVETILSLVIPYAAYLPAEQVGASGVIAAVTAGLILGYRSSRILTSETRLLAGAAWEILTFVLNGFAFLLIGLELRAILAGPLPSVPELVTAAVGVSAAVVLARFVWVYASLLVPRAIRTARGRRSPDMAPAVPLVVSWSGMRGALSLAAALALPLDFPERNLILLLTFVVIAVTLLGQGLTLPLLLRRIRLPTVSDDLEEETLARNQATEAALAKLGKIRGRWPDHLPLIENLEERYRHRLEHLPSDDGDGGLSLDPARQQERDEHHAISNAVLSAERETVIRLRDEGRIRDTVLRRIERELDLEEARLEADL
jgi:monovalent cation/hydrogen antiporter